MWDPDNPEAGWYRDPKNEALLRYWDGSAWTEKRLNADGSEIEQERFAVNPLGVGIVVLGAAVAILALFLPAAEAPAQFTEVQSNSLIQGQTGAAWLIAVAIAAAGSAFAAHVRDHRTWVPIVMGAIAFGAAIVIASTHSAVLTLYPLDESGSAITSAKPEYADPAIGLYVLGLGGVLMIVGGFWMRNSERIEDDETTEPNATKVCPDCAETIQGAARVCRYCDHRFEEAEAIAHADQAHTDLTSKDAPGQGKEET